MISAKTSSEVAAILDRYLTEHEQTRMLDELSAVKGNKSFMDSIKNLKALIIFNKKGDKDEDNV